MSEHYRITFLGLSLTSSWGNGHATIFRALVRALVRRGHDVTFLERDKPWYASNRDLPDPLEDVYGTVHLYDSLDDLRQNHAEAVRDADLVIVGSYVPDGVAVGQWVIDTAGGVPAFYDIDTPVTLAKLERGDHEYLTPELIRQYRLYFTFTGGPTLKTLEDRYGSPAARPLYCCVDPEHYYPAADEDGTAQRYDYDLGYMGTYSDDRQPPLQALLIDPAMQWPTGRFVVAGPQYPDSIDWPGNVERIDHLPPAKHRRFYNGQRFTLNITRADMRRAGYAPSVRLFEAAACGTPIISDAWPGLDTFFTPGEEILLAEDARDTLNYLTDLDDTQRQAIADAARQRVLDEHTADHRARELEAAIASASAALSTSA